MWGLATQAGAGMAIATLTATYFALARRNEEGRPLAHETSFGQGDGPATDNKERLNGEDDEEDDDKRDYKGLKKHLVDMSGLEGSTSGLNVLYQRHNPLLRVNKSIFELSPVISRVNTNLSTEDRQSEDHVVVAVNKEKSAECGPSSDNAAFSNREKHSAQISLPHKLAKRLKEEMKATVDSNTNNNSTETSSSVTKRNVQSVGDKWKCAQDNLILHRSKSPICFFKNPGFGNRYAFKIKQESPSPLIQRTSQLALTPDEITDGSVCRKGSEILKQTPTESRDSTMFILSPVLSESTVSIIDEETPEKILQQSKQPPVPDVEINPLDEISVYNEELTKKCVINEKGEGTFPLIRLRADPEICNLCPCPKPPQRALSPKRNFKPVMLPPELSRTPSQEKVENAEREGGVKQSLLKIKGSREFLLHGSELDSYKNQDLTPYHSDSEGVYEEPLVVPSQLFGCRILPPATASRSTATVPTIPNDSWIALPIRIYMNSMGNIPWRLIGFCICVVIIAGILGMFLSRLASNIQPLARRK